MASVIDPGEIREGRDGQKELYRLVNWLRRRTGSTSSADFWTSSDFTASIPSSVYMGGLGTGILQQTVTAGVSTPSAFAGTPGSVLFVGSDTLLAQDNATFFYNSTANVLGLGTNAPNAGATATETRLHVYGSVPAVTAGVRGYLRQIIQNGDDTGLSILLLANDLGILDPTTPFGGAGAAVYYTGSGWGGNEGRNRLVLMAPNPGIVATGVGIAFGISGDRKAMIEYVAASESTFQVCNPDQPSTGGLSKLLVDNNQAGVNASLVVYGHAHATLPDQIHLRADGNPLRFMIDNTERGKIDQAGDWFVNSLSAGGYVAATAGTGKLVIGAAPVPMTRTVTGTAPIAIAGDHAAHDLSADRVWSLDANGVTDAFIRQGAATSVIGRSANSVGNVADIAASADGDVLWRSVGALIWGHIPVSSVTGAVSDTTGLNATAPIRIDGGAFASFAATRTLSHADTAVVAGTYAPPSSFTVDAMGHLTAAAAFSLTTGSVIYWSGGTFTQDNAGFFFDSTNRVLALGTNSTTAGQKLKIAGNVTLASGTNPTWDAAYIDGGTLTLTGGTTVDSIRVARLVTPTITDGSAVTVTKAATLSIAGAPTAGGSVTISTALAFDIESGPWAHHNAIGTNYERVRASWSSIFGTTSWILKAEKGGAGTLRPIAINADTSAVYLCATGSGGNVYMAQNPGSTPTFAASGTQGQLKVDVTLASSAGLVVDAFKLTGGGTGIQITGGTAITTGTGANVMAMDSVTFNSAANITSAATLAIYGPPTISGGGAISVAYGLWVQAGLVEFGDNAILCGNGKTLGFFGSIGTTKQVGGVATAGLVYTATEQGMLQTAYDALRSYGLLT